MDEQRQVITDNYTLYNDDCLAVMSELPDKSIHFSCYSPPFVGLYHYSSSPRDLGNARSYAEFFEHYDYVIAEINRLTKSGRMTAIHCMDTPNSNTGRGDSITDFPGDIITHHVKCRQLNCTAPDLHRRNGMCGHGWFDLNARYHIWKEPLAVRNRTMAKKLAHKTIVDDSTKCGVAGSDYLLVFRKKGENQEPITHEYGLTNYAGATSLPASVQKYRGWTGKQIENKYSHIIWQRYASSCWGDIRLGNVLPYKKARDKDDEKHVHPLQLDVIERALVLFTNPGDIVLEPFMGVGSTVYQAVKMRRRSIGIELKDTYFRQAVKNLAVCVPCEDDERQTTMFEFIQDQA